MIAAYKIILKSKMKYFWIDPSLMKKTESGSDTQ